MRTFIQFISMIFILCAGSVLFLAGWVCLFGRAESGIIGIVAGAFGIACWIGVDFYGVNRDWWD